jgi:hypothetical protein
MSTAAGTLPTTEQLQRLLDSLRDARFKFGPDQIAGAEKILLLAHAEADDGLAARRLKTMLAPIFARTPTQQADFYRRFDTLMAEIAPAPVAARLPQTALASGASVAGAGAAAKRTRSRLAVITASVAALFLGVAGGLWLLRPPPPPPPPAPPVPNPTIATVTARIEPAVFVTATFYRREGFRLAEGGAMALPLLLFAGWMAWRWRRRLLWLERHPGVRDADPAVVRLPERHQPLFRAAELTAIARDLRRHLRVPSRDLDVDRTIPETLDAGGSFTPVWQTVPRSPSYLFLIERESAHDHVAGILDRAVDRFVGEQVAVERYHFRDDPSWLTGDDRRPGSEAIADIAARHGDHRLVVLAAGDGFFEPLNDRLLPRVAEALAQWTPRAVLSTKPIESWSWRELALIDQGGFDLATASHSGLRALAGRAAGEPDRPAEMLEGVVVSMPARTGRTRPQRMPSPAPRQGTKSAVLICVGPEDQAVAEVRQLARLLEGFGFNTGVLRDPDRRTAVDALASLFRTNTKPEDTILIHFRGRFAPGGDGAIFLGAGEGVAMPDFARLLHQPSAGHQVLVLDGVMYDRDFFQDTDNSAVAEGLGWNASATQALEVVWARERRRPKTAGEGEADSSLTGLLADTLGQDVVRAGGELTLRGLVDLARERARRLGILEDLNLNYFGSERTSAVIGIMPARRAGADAPSSEIFVSCAVEDQAAAQRLSDFLEEEAGIKVWLDYRDLPPAELWQKRIRLEIEECSFFMPLISAAALRRRKGFLGREWEWAAERARRNAGAAPVRRRSSSLSSSTTRRNRPKACPMSSCEHNGPACPVVPGMRIFGTASRR